MKKKNKLGDTINGFLFLEEIEKHLRPQKKKRRGVFKCYCGNKFESNLDNLSIIKSCGCYRIKQDKQKSKNTSKHTRLAWLYRDMTRKKNQNALVQTNVPTVGYKTVFRDFSERYSHNKFITSPLPKLCKEWLKNAQNFIDWSLNNGYSVDKELICNNKKMEYSPDNCEWKLIPNSEKSNPLHPRLSQILTYEKGYMEEYPEGGVYYKDTHKEVDREWLRDEHIFFKWSLTNGYTPKMKLIRKNIHGDTTPENCEWQILKSIGRFRTRATLTYKDVNTIRTSPHSPQELSHRFKTHIDSIYDIIHFRTWIGHDLEDTYGSMDYKDKDKHVKKFYEIMGRRPRAFTLVKTKKGELLKFYINSKGQLEEIEGGWRRIEEFKIETCHPFTDIIELNQPELSSDEYIWILDKAYGDNVGLVHKMSINPYCRRMMTIHKNITYTPDEFQSLIDNTPSILDMYFWSNNWGTMRKTYTDPNDWSKTAFRKTDKTYPVDEFYKLGII